MAPKNSKTHVRQSEPETTPAAPRRTLGSVGASHAGTFERLPQVKADELNGEPFFIVGARGPYTSRQYPDRPFAVFTLFFGDHTVGDLLLTHTGSQRQRLVETFASEPHAVIGPVTLEKLDIGRAKPMWIFEDSDAKIDPPLRDVVDLVIAASTIEGEHGNENEDELPF